MSIINCPSCGMQYDGSGMRPGVKFQCTECGAMIQVGGAPRPRPVGKRPTGQRRAAGGPPGRGPARNVPGRAPAGPARGPAGPGRVAPGGGGYPQGPGFGPPQKSNNTGLFVGLGIGAAVLLIVIIAVIASNSGSTSEEDPAAKAKREKAEQEAEIERQREEVRKRNEALTTTFGASIEMGRPIESALRNEDAGALSAMFDWNKYAAFNRQTMGGANYDRYAKDKAAVLYGEGEWVQDENGVYTGTYSWSTTRGADSLRESVMDYIKDFIFGAPEISWYQDKSKHDNSRFTIHYDSANHVGHRIFIEVGGSSTEFWVGAEPGSTNVKILNFVDKSAFSNMQRLVKEKNPERVDTSQRDPYNPDRDPRDPRNPEREDDDSDYDPDANLPALGKTGRMPTRPALVNAVKYAEEGLNTRRLQNVREESSVEEKHATMGALIDKLIDAQRSNDRLAKQNISLALYKIWDVLIDDKWTRDELVYIIDGVDAGGQDTSDLPIRRWLSIYNEYLEIMDGD